MLAYTDDVNGQIIGRVMLQGALYYDGRRQGRVLWAETDDAMLKRAKEELAAIKTSCGEAFGLIYRKAAWELRICD